MSDPYAVLGLTHGASEEEVKKAYRDLARRYHPDNYHDNPLADLAQEKMKEINEAYDAITKGGASSGYGSGGSAYASQSQAGGAEFSVVRSAINSGDLGMAERILQQTANRNAEWYFLMGSVYFRRGWLDEAVQYYTIACEQEPANAEYRSALNYVTAGNTTYRPQGFGAAPRRQGECDMCDVCTAMACANMCCRC
ncbi:MAG: J domain-containing protein [Oscillospiraceae bacterium]|jgi:curved DNA-binding protein CbpA|nr:J domain-containing protein [Oscillospiraceae bacterium]